MLKNPILRNFGVAVLVQFFSFVVSAATSFLSPKVLTVEEFGYLQLFLFYVGYIGFLQFGLNDGIYLRFGGRTKENLNKESVTSQFIASVISQVTVGLFVFICALVFVDDSKRLEIFVVIAIMIPICNCAWFLGYVFQAINETRQYSYSILIGRIIFFIPLIFLLVFGVNEYLPYALFYLIGQLSSFIYCLIKAKELFASILQCTIKGIIEESVESIKIGIQLLLATLASTLMIGFSRIVIDSIWDISTFGMVSLSISIISFFITMTAQASMVLFPAIRQISTKNRTTLFNKIHSAVLLVMPILFFLFYLIKAILLWWIPEYRSSLDLAILLMPICIFDGVFQVVYLTYFKVNRKENLLMKLNMFCLLLVIVFASIGGYLVQNIGFVLLCPTFVLIIRAFISNYLMARETKGHISSQLIWCTVMSAIFVISSIFLNEAISLVILAVAYLFYIIRYRTELVLLGNLIFKN